MKHGANFTDQNRIKALALEGLSAEEISEGTQISLECVKSFMPQPAAGEEVELDEGEDEDE